MADVSPLPKQKPVQDVSKHLRPISLVPILSKVVKEIVVEKFIKPAVLKIVNRRLFGTIPKSSTTNALISITIILPALQMAMANGSLARLVLFDFRFDHLLVGKLRSLDIPVAIVRGWVSDFLTARQQSQAWP